MIIDAEGRVVLTGRRSFSGALQWGLPKGIVEPGEAIPDAACREAREETGFTVEILSPLPTINYWYADHAGSRIHKFVHYFVMRPTGGNPADHDDETEEVVVLAPSEALRRASFRSERKTIEAALQDPR